jgi:hypothetical protein
VNPSLLLVLEGLKDGLLWMSADGKVKYANANATLLSGLKAGLQMHDCRLRKAVQIIGMGKLDKPVEMEFEPLAGSRPLLHAKAAPALSPGDVFVFLSPPAAYGDALALDNLMTVLRSDLGDPLKRLNRALEVAGANRDAGAIDEAVEQSKSLADTLSRLVDLSELWSSDSLLADDRIEIWQLLQQAWDQSKPFAESRKVTVRLVCKVAPTDLPVTYASEFWVKRVVTESLQAALRAASPGATLDIEVRPMGPRILIVFRNSGMWPAAAYGAVMLNDANARRAPGAARPTVNAKDLIGLHLCERIIGLLGGQLREEMDEGLRNFLIDLPCGAPYRDTQNDQAMDKAQAERYAADLSALMARRRKAPV